MYMMRKTPRSSFMVDMGSIVIPPSATYVPPPPPVRASTSIPYLMYGVVGGAALVAYLLFRKKG